MSLPRTLLVTHLKKKKPYAAITIIVAKWSEVRQDTNWNHYNANTACLHFPSFFFYFYFSYEIQVLRPAFYFQVYSYTSGPFRAIFRLTAGVRRVRKTKNVFYRPIALCRTVFRKRKKNHDVHWRSTTCVELFTILNFPCRLIIVVRIETPRIVSRSPEIIDDGSSPLFSDLVRVCPPPPPILTKPLTGRLCFAFIWKIPRNRAADYKS